MFKKILLLIFISFISFSQSFALTFDNNVSINKSNLLVAWDLTKQDFTIDTSKFTPVAHHSGNVKQVVNFVLWTIIQKLMIAIWAISLLVMTIWAWYMIFYHWQDELLSKGKSIFNAWIIALIVALSSYYIVSLVRLILYSNN